MNKMNALYSELIHLSIKKKRILISTMVLFLVVEAMALFPLQVEVSFMNGLVFFIYIEIGFIIRALFKQQALQGFLIVLAINSVGFMFRVWIEWQEATMMADLTIANVLITYGLITLLMVVGYLLAKRVERT